MTDLATLIEEQRQYSFSEPEKASVEDALGILIAQHFKWDVKAILRTASAALEDANYHTGARLIDEMEEGL